MSRDFNLLWLIYVLGVPSTSVLSKQTDLETKKPIVYSIFTLYIYSLLVNLRFPKHFLLFHVFINVRINNFLMTCLMYVL